LLVDGVWNFASLLPLLAVAQEVLCMVVSCMRVRSPQACTYVLGPLANVVSELDMAFVVVWRWSARVLRSRVLTIMPSSRCNTEQPLTQLGSAHGRLLPNGLKVGIFNDVDCDDQL
jgi:hypothetical protein